MRKLMSWLGALVLAVAVHAQDFTATLTAAEKEAAGLAKLTPAELARLREIVERYKAGEVAQVQQQAQEQVAANEAKVKEAQAKAAAAEAKAREAESKAAAAPAKKGPNWLTALVTLQKAGDSGDADEEIRARLDGTLKSFSGRRRFALDNGQVWEMIEADRYAGPTYTDPEVFIRPGILGTFWLRIPEAALRVKVKPLKVQ